MKKLLLCGAAALVLASCGEKAGPDKTEEINAALTQMSLMESGEGNTEFAEKSIKGDEVVFKDVLLKPSKMAAIDEAELDGDEPDLKAEEMIFKGLQLNEDGKSVFSKLTLNGMKIVPNSEDADGEGSIGTISLSNPTPELSAWVSGLVGKGDTAEAPATTKIGFDNFTLSDFVVKSEEEGGHFGIANIKVDDFRDFKAGKLSLDDMNFEFTDPESGQTGKFSLGGISASGMNMEFIQAFEEEDEDAIANKISEIMYKNPLDPGFDDFSVSKLNFDMEGVSFALPKMDYKVKRNADGVPTRLSMPEFNMTLSADQEGELGSQLAPMLAMLGFEDVKMSMAGESTYDPKTDISEGKEGFIKIDDAFKLSTTSKVGGMSKLADAMQAMDPEAFANGQQDPTQMMLQMYSELDFHNISISIEDMGIVDKAFSLAAAQQGADPAELKTQVTGMVSGLPFLASGTGIDMEILTELSTAASTFLEDGGTITISLNPAEPITIPGLMADPTAITKESLGFTASTK